MEFLDVFIHLSVLKYLYMNIEYVKLCISVELLTTICLTQLKDKECKQ